MRLPVIPPPSSPPADDLYQIRGRPPVTPAPFVRARNLPPLIVPPKKSPRNLASGEDKAQDGEQLAPSRAVTEERRQGERRTAQIPVLLDTRSGGDRRQRQDAAGAAIDVEA